MKSYLAISLLAIAAAASTAQAATQNYLRGEDVVSASQVSTTQDTKGVITVVMQRTDKVWVKVTLTPTTETLYGAFGEPVVTLESVFPNP